jgi:hypothetical protein
MGPVADDKPPASSHLSQVEQLHHRWELRATKIHVFDSIYSEAISCWALHGSPVHGMTLCIIIGRSC